MAIPPRTIFTNSSQLYKYEVVHINIRGARANKKNLEQYFDSLNYPEIVTLNETKLGYMTRFDINGYTCASRREPNPTGGLRGSMILVREDIKDVIEIDEAKALFRNDEFIGVEIKKTSNRPSLKVFTYYNPPTTYANANILQFISMQNSKCILAGDLNCKNMSWGSTRTDPYGEKLQDAIDQSGLTILNDGSKPELTLSRVKKRPLT